ncbi:hypothetical protein A3Q56_05440 [Intoshia linei]|uniref:SH3 domain-containing protein n=1 Tax=Intoshia linei TaxID=1819745 RepID=A0A177AXX0_9BILA|nr:hypothetical protein A3Q56_05440 [Intoshia linei]
MFEKATVIAKFNYKAQLPCEITLVVGNKYKLIERKTLWWLVENQEKVRGLAPSNYLKEFKKPRHLHIIKHIRNSLGKNKKLKKENEFNTIKNVNLENFPKVLHVNVYDQKNVENGLVRKIPSHNASKKIYKSNSMRTLDCKSKINKYYSRKISLASIDSIESFLELKAKSAKKKSKFKLFNPIMMNRRCSDNVVHTKMINIDEEEEKIDSNQFNANLEIYTANGMAYVRYSYESLMSDELSIKKGEILSILFKSKDAWWYGEKTNIIYDPDMPHSFYIHTAMKKDAMDNIVKKCDDAKQYGWFPSNYILPLSKDDEEVARIMMSTDFNKSLKKNRYKKAKSAAVKDEHYLKVKNGKNPIRKFKNREIKYAKAIENHNTCENDGLSLKIGDVVEVLKELNGTFMIRDQLDYVGYVPNFVIEIIDSSILSNIQNKKTKHEVLAKISTSNNNQHSVDHEKSFIDSLDNLENKVLHYTTEDALKNDTSKPIDDSSYLSFLTCYINTDDNKQNPPFVPLQDNTQSDNDKNIISKNDMTDKIKKIIETDSLANTTEKTDPIYDFPNVLLRKVALIKEIEKSRCFHKKFNHAMAEILLNQEKHAIGVFLIRPSKNEGQYTMVVKGSEKLRNFHMQIVDNDKIQIGSKEFQSLYEMIKYYSFNPLYKNDLETIFLSGSA